MERVREERERLAREIHERVLQYYEWVRREDPSLLEIKDPDALHVFSKALAHLVVGGKGSRRIRGVPPSSLMVLALARALGLKIEEVSGGHVKLLLHAFRDVVEKYRYVRSRIFYRSIQGAKRRLSDPEHRRKVEEVYMRLLGELRGKRSV